MKKFYLLLLFLLIHNPTVATNYYLSNSGNDSNSGTSDLEAWQTIAQLNTILLQPGDSVFFQAGSIFKGEITILSGGIENAPIYFGEYGVGDLPIISGADQVGGWTNYSGNIYRATLTKFPGHLFVDDKQMTIARFPNSGFLFFTSGIGDTGFVDSNLNQIDGYWNGANIRMRTSDRRWEVNSVSSFANDSILFVNNSLNEIQAEHGYYFDNLLPLLDTSGEWYYNEAGQDLYLNAPLNADPNSLMIEASVYDYGVEVLNASGFITIQNLEFDKQRKDGVYIGGVSNNIVTVDCRFSLQGEVGIRIPMGSNNCEVTHNSFIDINGMGIHMSKGHITTINRNQFKRIGIIPGYGSTLTENMCAVECFDCDSSTISENIIDSAGMCGIFSAMNNSQISKNVLDHCLLNVNDFGAIHIYSDDFDPEHSCLIQSNIVLNTTGNNLTTPVYDVSVAGIYLDTRSIQNELIENTIAHATMGIFLYRNTSENVLRKNLVYGCSEAQLKITEGVLQGTTIDNQIFSNTFYSLNESADVVKLISTFHNFQPAVFDSNYYFNPYAYHVFKTELGLYGASFPTYYTLSQWQNRTGMDQNSHCTFFNRNRFSVSDSISSNLISNSFFTNNFDGWITSESDTFHLQLDNSTPLDFGCMKLVFDYALPDTVRGVYTSGFKMDSGQLYQFHLSNYSVNDGNVVLKSKENLNGSYLASPQAFPFDNSRHDYNGFITPTNSCLSCLFSLELSGRDSVVWLDNITLYNVTGTIQVPEKKSRLFINTSDGNETFDLGDSIFFNLDQVPISGSFTLEPYSSAVLIFDSSMILSVHEHVMPHLLKIFPDPVLRGSTITLLIPQVSGDCEISVCDLEGKRLFHKMVLAPGENFQIKIPSSISPGTYFISVRNKSGVWSGKIVVM